MSFVGILFQCTHPLLQFGAWENPRDSRLARGRAAGTCQRLGWRHPHSPHRLGVVPAQGPPQGMGGGQAVTPTSALAVAVPSSHPKVPSWGEGCRCQYKCVQRQTQTPPPHFGYFPSDPVWAGTPQIQPHPLLSKRLCHSHDNLLVTLLAAWFFCKPTADLRKKNKPRSFPRKRPLRLPRATWPWRAI